MASNEATKKLDAGRRDVRAVPRAPAAAVPAPRPAARRVGPLDFLQQVRDEGRKVTWPTRKEATVTTIMVFVMVVLASLFFAVADQVLRYAVTLILGIGG